MKLNQLKALLAIADAGSIHEAARMLHLTPSALSKAVKELEREFGAALLTRSAKGMRLTECGLMLINRSRLIEAEIGRMHEDVARYRGALGGKLTIGHTGTAATLPLAEAVSDFLQRHPAVELTVLELRGAQIIRGLDDGTLDLGIISQYGAPKTSLRWHRMLSYDTMLVSNRRRVEKDTLATLRNEPWLMLDPIDDGESAVATLFAQFDLPPPKRIVRCSSVALFIQLAARVDTIMHCMDAVRPTFERYLSAGTMHRVSLPHALPKLHVYLQYRDESLLTAPTADFVASYTHHCQRWSDKTAASLVRMEMAA